jgi:hypothetical protein
MERLVFEPTQQAAKPREQQTAFPKEQAPKAQQPASYKERSHEPKPFLQQTNPQPLSIIPQNP